MSSQQEDDATAATAASASAAAPSWLEEEEVRERQARRLARYRENVADLEAMIEKARETWAADKIEELRRELEAVLESIRLCELTYSSRVDDDDNSASSLQIKNVALEKEGDTFAQATATATATAGVAPAMVEASIADRHNALFDSLFPGVDRVLGREVLALRLKLKQYTLAIVQARPEIQGLLGLLSKAQLDAVLGEQRPDFGLEFHESDVVTQDHLLMMLRRHPVGTVSAAAFMLRKVYLTLCYGTRLPNGILVTDLISGMDTTPRKPRHVDYTLPPSKLEMVGNKVVHMEGKIDYLIIGSGPAGSLIASELARLTENKRIVIVDAGAFVKPGSVETTFETNLMESGSLRHTVTGGINLRNGQGVGGGTAVNVDLAFSPRLPLISHRIHSWMDQGLVSRDIFNDTIIDETYDWLKHWIGTRQPRTHEANRNNRLLANGSVEVGLEPALYGLNARKPSLHTLHKKQTGRSRGESRVAELPAEDWILKISAVDAFLNAALQEKYSSKVSLITKARATKLLFHEDGTISGAKFRIEQPWEADHVINDAAGLGLAVGTEFEIEATRVILSAGTLGSAEVLLRSEIQNDQIGRGVVMHPSIGFPAFFPAEIFANEGLSATIYVPSSDVSDNFVFECMAAEPAYGALVHPGNGQQILELVRNSQRYGGFGMMVVDEPDPNNRVFIDENGNVQVHYQKSELTKERFRKGVEMALRAIRHTFASQVDLPTCEDILDTGLNYEPIRSEEDITKAIQRIQFIENQNFFTGSHMQSSNKMGNDPKTSVVSQNFKVWNQATGREIEDLYVVDSSIFPTSCGANPMQTIYTTAKRFVDHVLLGADGLKR